ncbi:SMI1/KNR4 family protein [Xenorhabdus budapestensis]|uniref:SMI1/KNR4 family protein n=1 Tax=Xenorhabdus budapestensis TaxID=290110 RepID=A0ABX7VGX7_XENBU|nr:SMI1/KNR4 family protein [Xenorhabdus budapestensis]QTL39047.1 SMI1/KNR4 family protein [Xenorhabdus budapestensis]
MIPKKVSDYIKSKDWYILREDNASCVDAIRALGIDLSSEFSSFYQEIYCDLISPKPIADLLDIDDIKEQFDYIKDRYELSDDYIPLTSDESEGMYLFNKKNNSVYDFNLSEYDSFIEGKINPRWSSFNDFLIWYFDESNLDDI